MVEDLEKAFESVEDEYMDFQNIQNPPHPRRDISAFLKLHELVPGKRPMVSSASHDLICLDVDFEALRKAATQEDILFLHRCGVAYDMSLDCLSMNV